MASQDYDCDNRCGRIIPDETEYVRVAVLEDLGHQKNSRDVLTARTVEKFHPECWEEINDLAR